MFSCGYPVSGETVDWLVVVRVVNETGGRIVAVVGCDVKGVFWLFFMRPRSSIGEGFLVD